MADNPFRLAPPQKIRTPSTATKSFAPKAPRGNDAGGNRSIHDNMGGEMKAARQQLDKIVAARKMLDVAGEEFGNLSMLHDMVTTEDVSEAAANLVARGAKAHDMAGLLSTMPPPGQALADWVKQHLMDMQKMMQQVEQAEELARHQLAVSATRHLAAHHLEPQEQLGGPQDGNSMTLGSAPPDSNAATMGKGQLAPGSGPVSPNPHPLGNMEVQGNA